MAATSRNRHLYLQQQTTREPRPRSRSPAMKRRRRPGLTTGPKSKPAATSASPQMVQLPRQSFSRRSSLLVSLTPVPLPPPPPPPQPQLPHPLAHTPPLLPCRSPPPFSPSPLSERAKLPPRPRLPGNHGTGGRRTRMCGRAGPSESPAAETLTGALPRGLHATPLARPPAKHSFVISYSFVKTCKLICS